jgi:hypothetical protein
LWQDDQKFAVSNFGYYSLFFSKVPSKWVFVFMGNLPSGRWVSQRAQEWTRMSSHFTIDKIHSVKTSKMEVYQAASDYSFCWA